MLEVKNIRSTANKNIVVLNEESNITKSDFWPATPIDTKVIVELSKD